MNYYQLIQYRRDDSVLKSKYKKKYMSNQASSPTPFLLTLASLVVVIAGLKVAAPLIAQFLMALFIAVVCMPSIRWMELRKIPRGIAILIVLSPRPRIKFISQCSVP